MQNIFAYLWCDGVIDSHGAVDCNIALELSLDEQTIHNASEALPESLDSTSRNHITVLDEVSPRGNKVLELLDERIGEASLSHHARVRANDSSLQEVGGNHKDCVNFSSTSQNNYLQVGSTTARVILTGYLIKQLLFSFCYLI